MLWSRRLSINEITQIKKLGLVILKWLPWPPTSSLPHGRITNYWISWSANRVIHWRGCQKDKRYTLALDEVGSLQESLQTSNPNLPNKKSWRLTHAVGIQYSTGSLKDWNETFQYWQGQLHFLGWSRVRWPGICRQIQKRRGSKGVCS